MTVLAVLASLLVADAAVASAKRDGQEFNGFVAAVKAGDDLSDRYGAVLSERERKALTGLKGCEAFNLMQQGKGEWSAVWVCKGELTLGTFVTFKDGMLTAVETSEVERRRKYAGDR